MVYKRLDFSSMDYKETFLELARINIKRDGIEKLLSWLSKKDFFTAPASTKFHMSCEGGLAKHSLNVYNRLINEVEIEYGSISDSPYSMETLTIVSLMHDLCKVEYYVVSSKNVKNDEGKWIAVPYYAVDEKLPIVHSTKSQYILRSYIDLTREESVAILSHMGQYDASSKGGDYSITNAFNKYELAFLLHIADLKATNIDENEKV